MVVQACMVSGEPLSSSIYSEFDCVLAEAGDSQSLALLSELDHFDIEEVYGRSVLQSRWRRTYFKWIIILE